MIDITDQEFRVVAEYIKKNYGINLRDEKQALVAGRLQIVLQQKGFKNFSDYFRYIISDATGDGINTFIEKITTNHTFFMREKEHFDFVRDKVLPTLVNSVKDRDLRIWSAGCSSGEEPYTLAMLVDDFLGQRKQGWDTKILATDISARVLEMAQRGMYPASKITAIPPHWRLKYFEQIDQENYVLSSLIRNEVIFRKFNLMEKAFPFKKKFHIIFCRNVMIYFDNKTKVDLVKKFYDLTEPGGYLFIGHAESIGRTESKYRHVMPAVYRKEQA